MRFNKLILLLLPLLIGSAVVYGQKIYREGYIVKNSGDTLNGLIQFEQNQKIDQKCIFKRFDLAITVIYTPESLKSFGYKNGSFYEAREIDGKRIFLECLVKGKLSLYAISKKMYIEGENQDLIELKNGTIKKTKGNNNYDFTNLTKFLAHITSDVSGIIIPTKIKVVDSDLIPIIKDYNEKANTSYVVYNRKVNKNIFDEAIMQTGVNMKNYGIVNTINVSQSTLSSALGSSFNKDARMNISNKNWALGFFYNSKLSRINKNISWQVELLFSKRSSYSYFEFNKTVPVETNRIDLHTYYSIFSLPIMLQYSKPIKNIPTYVSLGLVYCFSFNRFQGSMDTEMENGQIYNYSINNEHSTTKQILGFVGLGIKQYILGNKTIFFEVRTEFGKVLNHDITFDSYNTPKLSLNQNSTKFIFLMGFGF